MTSADQQGKTFTHDVFLSHNQADRPRVRRLAERLRAAGLRVWFDEWVIQPGDDIYLAIERGLEAARTLVLPVAGGAGIGLGGAGAQHRAVSRSGQRQPSLHPAPAGRFTMNRPGQLTAMISSTALDLPEHRAEAQDACLRQGVFPIGMEALPARDASGIRASLEMVDQADIYLGIYAHRYGWIPDGHDISITEMEFNRAVERGIPILVFLIHKDHALTIEMVETGDLLQKKLAAFKQRASKDRIRAEFKSPADLRGQVIQALAALEKEQQQASGKTKAPDFHPPNIIPRPPEPYIAHPYSLLQTKDVVGRQDELNLLTDWVTTNKVVPAGTRLFNQVAIGGMGKSALTWKWFNDIAPNELPKLAGRLWWSFYESDAHWENFIIRALTYVSGQSEKTVREMKAPDREDQLWHILDQQPFLLVLDGLERILLAYARMDAAQMLDEDLDDKTANRVAQAIGLPPSAADSFIGKHQLRLTADHRAGYFLRRLIQVRKSRILITTRLYPTELQCETGEPLPGCIAQFLTGLTDSDALNLWREFKVTGSAEQLLPLFRSFNNYPLLIRALAGEVAAFRGGPGDFDKWRAKNPKFDPTQLPLKNAKTHVLEFALRGLKDEQRKVLHTIAAFRMPATWETLRALLVEPGRDGFHPVPDSKGKDGDAVKRVPPKPCATDQALDLILTELEDRGLVGWDKTANRYDLHPIVRSVVWATLAPNAKQVIHRDLHDFFDAAPRPPAWRNVKQIEDLTPAIELFRSLVEMGRYEDASNLFFENLDRATNYRLSASRLRIELLQTLVDTTDDGLPRVQNPSLLLGVLNGLGKSFSYAGDLVSAIEYFRCAEALSEQSPLLSSPDPEAQSGLAAVLRYSGHLFDARSAGLRALKCWERESRSRTSFEEGRAGMRLGLTLAACAMERESRLALARATKMAKSTSRIAFEAFANIVTAQCCLWFSDHKSAHEHAKRAWNLVQSSSFERDFVRCARVQGEAALRLGNVDDATERLHYALNRARSINLVDEELPILTALAELHRRKNEPALARELLNQVWDAAERGPYPSFHSDALNVLAQIERDQGNRDAAITAATKAYTLAWCDGISADGKVCYAYHYGLTNARKHLQELRAPEPQLPPFDESKFPPLPNVELNPKDEFWVDPASLDSNP